MVLENNIPGALLGHYLDIRVNQLRERLGTAAFNEFLRTRKVTPRSVNDLGEGYWSSVAHRTLLLLSILAKSSGVGGFIELIDSEFWRTFQRSDANLVLAGRDGKGHHFPGDFVATQMLQNAGIKCGFIDVRPDESEMFLERMMREQNLLIVGSSKNNVATDYALRRLWGGNPPLRFLLPGIYRNCPTVAESPTGERILELRNRRLEERGDARRIGIVVLCQRPIPDTQVSTVIVAGCSGEATYLMINDLQESGFYRHYTGGATVAAGEPILFIFDSSKPPRHRWKVDGHETPSARKGRPRKA